MTLAVRSYEPRGIEGDSHQQPHERSREGAPKRYSHRRHVRREHEVPAGMDRSWAGSCAPVTDHPWLLVDVVQVQPPGSRGRRLNARHSPLRGSAHRHWHDSA